MPQISGAFRPWRRPRNIIIAASLCVAIVIGWFIREVLRVYLADPVISHNYRQDYRADVMKLTNQTSERGEKAWAQLIEALDLSAKVFSEIENRRKDENFVPRGEHDDGTLSFTELRYADIDPNDFERELDAILEIQNQGVFDRLADFCKNAPGLRPTNSTNSMLVELMPELSKSRQLAKALAADMRLRAAAGDFRAVATDFQYLQTMARTISLQPGMICYLVGAAIDTMTLSELRLELLEYQFDEPTCALLLQTIEQQPLADFWLALRGEQLSFHDFLQNVCSDTGDGDGYLLPHQLETVGYPIGREQRYFMASVKTRFFLAPRREMESNFDAYMNPCINETRKPTRDWDQSVFDVSAFVVNLGSSRHDVLRLLLESNNVRWTGGRRLSQVQRQGTQIMVALAAYRASEGRYPESLDLIAPTYLSQPPQDLAQGARFGYRLLSNDAHDRPYLLYSIGMDGVDDGGAFPGPRDMADAIVNSDMTGIDYEINPVRQPPDP